MENFRCLCTGEGDWIVQEETPTLEGLHFPPQHSQICVPGWGLHPLSGESIYGPSFSDKGELERKHTSHGILMANSGRNTNGFEFLITLTRPEHQWLSKEWTDSWSDPEICCVV